MNNRQDDLIQLYSKILDDPKLDPKQKKMMFNEVRKLIPAEQNRWTLRWVIWFLGAVVLSVPAYTLFNLCKERPLADMPQALLSVGSTALGALATFLTHYTRRAGEGKGVDKNPPARPMEQITIPSTSEDNKDSPIPTPTA